MHLSSRLESVHHQIEVVSILVAVEAAVLAAPLTVTSGPNGTRTVSFAPPGGADPTPPKVIDFPWSQDKSTLRMPTVGGVPLQADPAHVYDGPFMQSVLGERTATVQGDGLVLRYDFADDSVRQL